MNCSFFRIHFLRLGCLSSRASRSTSAQSPLSFDTLEPRQLLAADANAGSGWLAQFYADQNLGAYVTSSVDPSLNEDWAASAPVVTPPLNPDDFSVRWSSEVEAEFSETHTFYVNAAGGVRLYINGQRLFDRWNDSQITNATTTFNMIAGRRYDIQLEFRESSGNASVKLEWSSASQPREIIPTSHLLRSQRGSILSEQWNGIPGTTISSLTSSSKFNQTPDSMVALDNFSSAENVADNFGRRIRGYVHADQTGAYQFYIAGDDTTELWLSNSTDPAHKQRIAFSNAVTSVQQWNHNANQESLPIQLVAGQSYYIEALHKEGTQGDHLAVGWRPPGSPSIVVIPGQNLSPILPTVKIFAVRPTISENVPSEPAVYEVVRSGTDLTNALAVNYRVRGTATNGVDFQTLSGTITIPAGQASVNLMVTPIVDSLSEGQELIEIELADGAGYSVGLVSERTVQANLLDDRPSPIGGTSLLGSFISFGATVTNPNVAPFGTVIQAAVTENHTNYFDAQVAQPINHAIGQGDLLLVDFYVRSLNVAGQARVVLETNGPPYSPSLSEPISVDQTWRRIQIPFVAETDYAVNGAWFSFQIGQQIQTLQFANIRLTHYGPSANLRMPNEFGNFGAENGLIQDVFVAGESFSIAKQMQTITVPTYSWEFQISTRTAGPVAIGSTIQVDYWARATAGTNPKVEAAILDVDNNYQTLATHTIDLTGGWQPYTLQLTVNKDFSAEKLQLTFMAGFGLQTIEIGDVRWRDLSRTLTFEELPKQTPATTYGGRSGTANWRESADQRIVNQRQAPVTVQVRDANGKPIDGAVVNLRQTQHQFLFGSAVNSYRNQLNPNGSPIVQKYQSEVLRLFNAMTDEGALQWNQLINDLAQGSVVADFADQNDLYMRGHSGIWPSRAWMPPVVWAQYDSLLASQGATVAANYLRDQTTARITEIATTFANVTDEWDVVNEPRVNRDVMDVLGDAVLVDWFRLFRQLDPGAKLSLNEYGLWTGNGNDTAAQTNFAYWVNQLKAENLVDTIGEQSHYDEGNLTDIATLGNLIQGWVTQFNLPISVTELDVNSKDEQLQADYLRDFLTMSFSQSGIEKIVQWGFWESSHWRPDAALYRTDFSIKPNGQVYEDLVFGDWWTDVRATTRSGNAQFRATLGSYDVEVTYNGQRVIVPVTSITPGQTITVNLLGITAPANVLKEYLFYNQSKWDGNSALAGVNDDGAIDSEKIALRPGNGAATWNNYTNYTRGINGIMLDIANLPVGATLATSNFSFKIGNDNNPAGWSNAPTPSISIRLGAGIGGSDRVTLVWSPGAIQKQWLEITVRSTAATGLSNDHLFYFGNAIGDVGINNANGFANVNASDEIAVRLNPGSSLSNPPVTIANRYDFNRDGNVNASDQIAARLNTTSTLGASATALRLIAPTGAANIPVGLSGGLVFGLNKMTKLIGTFVRLGPNEVALAQTTNSIPLVPFTSADNSNRFFQLPFSSQPITLVVDANRRNEMTLSESKFVRAAKQVEPEAEPLATTSPHENKEGGDGARDTVFSGWSELVCNQLCQAVFFEIDGIGNRSRI